MEELEYIRREVRSNGYLSALQIVIRLAKRQPGISKDEVDAILKQTVCKDIHKIVYTNSYVSALKLKDLYYYNPSVKAKKAPRPRKKLNAKKKTKVL